jgi:hypothetical protein
MEEHIHTGFVVFVSTGVYAILFIWLLRLIAAHLVTYGPTETAGKALGGLVHFGS